GGEVLGREGTRGRGRVLRRGRLGGHAGRYRERQPERSVVHAKLLWFGAVLDRLHSGCRPGEGRIGDIATIMHSISDFGNMRKCAQTVHQISAILDFVAPQKGKTDMLMLLF